MIGPYRLVVSSSSFTQEAAASLLVYLFTICNAYACLWISKTATLRALIDPTALQRAWHVLNYADEVWSRPRGECTDLLVMNIYPGAYIYIYIVLKTKLLKCGLKTKH
jgi:hypothetical protein